MLYTIRAEDCGKDLMHHLPAFVPDLSCLMVEGRAPEARGDELGDLVYPGREVGQVMG